MTLLGLHVTTGSREGYGLVAPYARGVMSFLADAFTEVSSATYRIYRPSHIYRYGGQHDRDIMPGFDQLRLEDMAAQADYWWPIILQGVRDEEARLGVRIDALKLTNEVGANDRIQIQKLLAYEAALIPKVKQAGYRLVCCNLAKDSPHRDNRIWQDVIKLFVQTVVWPAGMIYGRHLYEDNGNLVVTNNGMDVPAGPGTQRLWWEMAQFSNDGPVGAIVIGELGFVSFPGVEKFMDQVVRFDFMVKRDFPNLLMCLFTEGVWNDANIQQANKRLGVYMNANPFSPWNPGDATPPPSGSFDTFVTGVGRSLVCVPIVPKTALQAQMIKDGYIPTGPERWEKFEGKQYAIQPAGKQTVEGDVRDYWVEVGNWGNVGYVIPGGSQEPWTDIVDDLPKHPTKTYKKRQLAQITTAVIHHTVGPAMQPIKDIATYHVNHNDWPGIGYHFVINGNGEIFQTNYLDTVSYHAGGYNDNSIGIALQGNFTSVQPTEAQLVSGRTLLDFLKTKFTLRCTRHRDLNQTACPGATSDSWIYRICGGNPPSGTGHNLSQYFVPSGATGKFFVSHATDGSFTQDRQLVKQADGSVLMVKGSEYERWRISPGGGYLERREDTSPGKRDGKRYAYRLDDGHGWSKWCPIVWQEGRLYERKPTIIRYWLEGSSACQEFERAATTDYLKFEKHYDAAHPWTSPGNSAIILADVVELRWLASPTGPVLETYWYAKDFGLVGWTNFEKADYIAEIPTGRDPLNPTIPCPI